jgi:ketosteroid isomerase-like protein
LSSFQTPLDYEVRDLSVTTGGDVAFSHSLNHIDGTTKDGQRIEMFWRSTVGFRKIDGQWIATHQHSSVPFDPESGRASVDLRP